MRLLQSTWAELLTLTMAFRSLEQFNGQNIDGGSDIDCIGGVDKESCGNGLKLRYATDYWLDEQLARECCLSSQSMLNGVSGMTTTTTTTSSTTSGLGVAGTMPTVLDIYNLVSIIGIVIISQF